MHGIIELRQKLNDILFEKDVKVPAYLKFRFGPARDYKPADLIRMWADGLDAPEMAEALSRTEDAAYPVKAETIQAQLVDLRSVIRRVLEADPENGMEKLETALGSSAADIKYLLVKRPRDTHPGDNLTKEARRLIQSGEATSQKDLVAKLTAYARANKNLRSTKLSAIEKAATNARREANLTAGKGQKWKHPDPAPTMPVVFREPKRKRGRPISVDPNTDEPTARSGKSLRYWFQKNKLFRSAVIPLPFRELILLHNDAKNFDEFLLDVEQVLNREVELSEMNNWCNRIRMLYSQYFARGGDVKVLTDGLRLSLDEIQTFMTQPKKPEKVPIVPGIHRK